jgi:simple sugar transport system permease protein
VIVPLEDFLAAAVRTATPLAFAALGECVTERSGVINIGLEGSIICGALAATIVAGSVGVTGGFAAGAAAGLIVTLIFALFTVFMRADQIITGTAITLLSLGFTGLVYKSFYGATGVGLTIPTIGAVDIPLLAKIPLLGRAFFSQPVVTYALYAIVPVMTWWFWRTHTGLAVRAVGESPDAALAAGVRPRLVQLLAVLFGGAFAGIAGATLVLAQSGTFVENMSAGKGFIAIAIVVLGRWTPLGVTGAALLFGGASALQYLFQSLGWSNVPYQLFLALPYVLTLVVLARASGRSAAPAALARRKLTLG